METDLRLYLACMPVQRERPTLRVAIGTPLTSRAGGTRRSVSRPPRSRAFDGGFGQLRLELIQIPHLEFQSDDLAGPTTPVQTEMTGSNDHRQDGETEHTDRNTVHAFPSSRDIVAATTRPPTHC